MHGKWATRVLTRFVNALLNAPLDLSLLRATRWNDWPADILYIWTNDENLPRLQHLVEERWLASEIGVLLPEDEEMMMANLSDEDNRVLYVWWD